MTSSARWTGAVLFLALVATGCRQQEAATTPASPDSELGTPMSGDTTFRATGTIHRVNVEGGCWRFDLEGGGHFELRAGADPSILVDGRQATLTLRPRPDLMSACQIGPIAEVVDGA